MSNELISSFEVDNYYEYHTIIVSIIIGALISIYFRVQRKWGEKHKRGEKEIERVRHEIKKLNNDIHYLEMAITKYVSEHTKKKEDRLVKLLGFKCEFLLCLTDDEKQDIKSNIHLDQEIKKLMEKFPQYILHEKAKVEIMQKYSVNRTCKDILSEFTLYQDFSIGTSQKNISNYFCFVTNKILYKKIGKALYAYLYVWDYLRNQITLDGHTISYFNKPIYRVYFVQIGGRVNNNFNGCLVDLRDPIAWTEY